MQGMLGHEAVDRVGGRLVADRAVPTGRILEDEVLEPARPALW
jgi:hypothetical protein